MGGSPEPAASWSWLHPLYHYRVLLRARIIGACAPAISVYRLRLHHSGVRSTG
jgi:hypothetical protein